MCIRRDLTSVLPVAATGRTENRTLGASVRPARPGVPALGARTGVASVTASLSADRSGAEWRGVQSEAAGAGVARGPLGPLTGPRRPGAGSACTRSTTATGGPASSPGSASTAL